MSKGCMVLLLVVLGIVVLYVMAGGSLSSRASVTLPVTPSVGVETYSVVGKPSVSGVFIDRVLVAYGSPAVGLGQDMYSDGVEYGIDPVYGLAWFLHEDDMGKTGWGAVNHSLGNTICSAGYQCRGGFRAYPTWQAGFADWFALIRRQYVDIWHLTTVAQIVPVYAPGSAGNDVPGYIAAIERAVDTWRSGQVDVQ